MTLENLKKAQEIIQILLDTFGFCTISDIQTFAVENPDQFWKEIEDRKIDLEKEPTKKTK